MTTEKDESSHYVDNKKLLEEIIKYKQQCEENEDTQVPEYIAECILLIAENLTNKPNFINYKFKGEMIGEAVLDCLKAVRNFKQEKSDNPFSYFTTISWYAFLRVIKKEKKQDKVKFGIVKRNNAMGDYTDYLKRNGHLDDHACENDIQRYHFLTDEDLQEIEDVDKTKPDVKTPKKRKKKTNKKPLVDED